MGTLGCLSDPQFLNVWGDMPAWRREERILSPLAGCKDVLGEYGLLGPQGHLSLAMESALLMCFVCPENQSPVLTLLRGMGNDPEGQGIMPGLF